MFSFECFAPIKRLPGEIVCEMMYNVLTILNSTQPFLECLDSWSSADSWSYIAKTLPESYQDLHLPMLQPVVVCIVLQLLLVRLILHASPPHSPHLHSHHLSLRRPFTPDLSRKPFLHRRFGSIWTAFTDLGLGPDLVATVVCFSFFFIFFVFGYGC